MTSENEDDLRLSDVIAKVKAIFAVLRARWLIILASALITGVLAFLWASRMPVQYFGKITFLVENGRSGSSALSAISGQFGIELPTSSGREMFAGDNMIGLLKSKRISKEALLSSFDNKTTLADRYADVYGLRKSWKQNEKIGKEIFFTRNTVFTRQQDSLLQVVQEQISEALQVSRVDKKMSFFSVSLSLKDEELTKLYLEQVVKKAVDFYILTKTERQRLNVARLEKRADSIARVLNIKTYSSAREKSAILDVNPAYQTALIGAEASERSKGMFGIIYAEILGNLEAHKASLTQETPVIQIIDEAGLPLKIEKANVLKLTLAGIFLGLLLSSSLVLFVKIVRKFW